MKEKKRKKKDPMRVALGRRARNKGQSYENHWCHMMREVGVDPDAKRNLTETRDPDIDVETYLPLAFQVRSGIGVSMWKALEDAEKGQKRRGKEGWPVGVIFETDRQTDCFIIMRFLDFAELVGKIGDGKMPPFNISEHEKAHIAAKNLFRKGREKTNGVMDFYLIELPTRPAVVVIEGYEFLHLIRIWLGKKKIQRHPRKKGK